jgi:hypothetical protein
MRIALATATALAMIPLGLTGCASKSSSTGQAAPAPPSAAAVAWTGQLCGLVGGFVTAQHQVPALNKSNTQTFKDSSVAEISASEKAASDAYTGLRGMGPSPIPGTSSIPGNMAQSFGQVRDILDSAKTTAQQVNTSNEQTFVQGMTAVQQQLQKGQSVNFGANLAAFDKNPQLAAAAAQAPTCKSLMKPPPKGKP